MHRSTIGASDNAVAWTAVQEWLATGFSIEPGDVGVTSAEKEMGCSVSFSASWSYGTDASVQELQSALDETVMVTTMIQHSFAHRQLSPCIWM